MKEEIQKRGKNKEPIPTVEERRTRAVLVAVIRDSQNPDTAMEYLDELEFLAETANIESVRRFTQRLPQPLSKIYVGPGKLEEIALWCKRTGAEYQLYWADELVLRNMVRSNPGVLLLKDGVIVGKWNLSDLPPVEDMASAPTGMPDSIPSSLAVMRGWLFWMLLLAVPLLLFVSIDAAVCRASRRVSVAASAEQQSHEGRNAENTD